jgi:Skp family chaperone for outer membrane proteins
MYRHEIQGIVTGFQLTRPKGISMGIRRLAPVVAIAVCALAAAASVPAQTPAAAGPTLGGPAIQGICLLSREAIFARSKVGLAASARLDQLAKQAESEIAAERKPIDTDVQAFRQQAASMKPDERQSRDAALGQRIQAAEAHRELLSREIEATRVKALARIGETAQPVIADVYKTKGCGLLLDRGAVLGGNMANDLTAGVVQGLDAKITTITFERENLPAGPAGKAQ